ncbi:pyruvate dehydrogenase complex dehydrogenase (E1) component, partial [Arthrobacter bambusae]|nr:pyruvate dehydrogenase complex dehydrogenase (E1) component [Arthrobacter bambusae]
ARRYFKNDTHSIIVKTLQLLARRGEVDPQAPSYAMDRYKLLDVTAGTTGGAGGES